MAETTCNAFLGGKVQILQPVRGYRAGLDPVLLAASVPAQAGQSVLELGCGVGTVSLCLGARVQGLEISAVELQPEFADLAKRNATQNQQHVQVYAGDLADMPGPLRAQSFDHVVANPPFFQRDQGRSSPDPSRETGRGEAAPLSLWVSVAARRLRPGGMLSFVHRAERLPDLVKACDDILGSIEVLPLQPRTGRIAKLVILRARKGGRTAFRLHAPITLHQGSHHMRDGDDYTPLITSVLRNGAALPFGAVD